MSSLTVQITQLIEHLRCLHYPHLRTLTVTAFNQHSFTHIHTIIAFLLTKLDNNIHINNDVSTPEQRVQYLQSVASVAYSTLHIKLNLKPLYRADVFAVKELLKITRPLVAALKMCYTDKSVMNSNATLDIPSSFLADMSSGAELCTDLLNTAERLDKLLEVEMGEHSEKRRNVLNVIGQLNQLTPVDAERALHKQLVDSIQYKRSQCGEIGVQLKELRTNIRQYEDKLTKKTVEFTRLEKRLDTLKKLKPAFLNEYGVIEQQVRVLYSDYIHKYKNLQFVQQQLRAQKQHADEKKSEADKHIQKMQQKLNANDLKQLRGEVAINDGDVVYKRDEDENGDDVFDSDMEQDMDGEHEQQDSSDDDDTGAGSEHKQLDKRVQLADGDDSSSSDDGGGGDRETVRPMRAATGRYKTGAHAQDSSSDSDNDGEEQGAAAEDDDYF